MINFCLNTEEKELLKSLKGKKLVNFRHDSFDKFEGETVYGKIELFFEDSIVLINYDYAPYPLFGSEDDEHPKFSIKLISENDAVSALKDTKQINVHCGEVIRSFILIEDYYNVEWDNKKDETQIMKALIIVFEKKEIAIKGDYMIPLLDIIKGINLKAKIADDGEEFDQEDTNFEFKRSFVNL